MRGCSSGACIYPAADVETLTMSIATFHSSSLHVKLPAREKDILPLSQALVLSA